MYEAMFVVVSTSGLTPVLLWNPCHISALYVYLVLYLSLP